jgi:predicted permease
MENLLLLVICMVGGVALRASRRLPPDAHLAFNGFLIHVSLPALALATVPKLQFDAAMASAVALSWCLFGLGAGFFWAIGRMFSLPRSTVGGLILTGGLGSTSFVGIPMIEALHGPEFVAVGVMVDQLGTCLTLSTLGVAAAALAARKACSLAGIAKRVLTFPPFLAVLAALVLGATGTPLWLEDLSTRLASTLAPLALVSVGYQLRLGDIRHEREGLVLGLGFKLMLAPSILLLLYVDLLGLSGPTTRIALLETAMAPMICGALVAIQHGLNPRLASLMVGIGVPLSFLTVPFWWFALRSV